MFNKKNAGLAFVVITFLLGAILFANRIIPFNSIRSFSDTSYEEVVLTPAEIVDNYKNDPYVRIRPSSLIYPIIRLIETWQHPHLSDLRFELGRKRIAELIAWGESIPKEPIKISSNPLHTAQELITKRKRTWLTYVTFHTTWETLLSDYIQECEYATDQHNPNLNQPWHLESILYAIRRDERLLLGNIENPGLAITNRQYAYTIASATFTYCKERLENIGYVTDPHRQNYTLPVSISARMTPYIKSQSVPYATNIQASTQHTSAATQLRETPSVWEGETTLSLKPNDRTINTLIHAEPITQLNTWNETVSNNTKTSETSVTIPQDLVATRLLITIDNIPSAVNSVYIWKDSDLYNPVQNTYARHTQYFSPFYLPDTKNSYEMIVYEIPNEQVKMIHIKFTQSPPSDAHANISVTPLYQPSILLAGKMQSPAAVGPIIRARQWLAKYTTFILLLNIASVAIVLSLRVHSIKQNVTDTIQFVFSKKNVFTYLLPLTILAIILDVALSTKHISIYQFLLIPFCITLYILAPSGKTMSRHIGILFFLAYIGYLFKQSVTEALFRWGYLYFFVALFIQAGRQHDAARCESSSALWYRYYNKLMIGMKYLYKRVFHIPVRNRGDYLHNTFIVLLTVFIGIFSVLLTRKLNSITDNYNRIPVITKVEMKTAYPGNIIVVRGKHFGWNTDQNSRIMSMYGDMHILDWKDNKIVFQLPTNTRVGRMWIQIAKYDVWFNEVKLLTSKKSTMQILNTSQKWSNVNDQYLQELETVSHETKRLNGAP